MSLFKLTAASMPSGCECSSRNQGQFAARGVPHGILPASALRLAAATRKIVSTTRRFHSSSICSEDRRLCYGLRETTVDAEASDDSPARIGGRRGVLGDGGRRIGGSCADGEWSVARRRTASRVRSRRGGNLRRQPGDVLRLRQGRPIARRTPAVRPERLQRRRRLCSTGLRRTRLRSSPVRRRPVRRRPVRRRPVRRSPVRRRLPMRSRSSALRGRLWRLHL